MTKIVTALLMLGIFKILTRRNVSEALFAWLMILAIALLINIGG